MKNRVGDYIQNKLGLGTFCVLACLISFLVFMFLSLEYPLFKVPSDILMGGVIGGITNTIAIKMMFRKYYFLPGSGVLLKKKDEIVQSLADTVDSYIFNPMMIEDKLKKALGQIDIDKIRTSLNAGVDEFRDDMLKFINSEETTNNLAAILKEKLGIMGKILNLTGIKDFEMIAHEILDYVDEKVEHFEIDDAMLQAAMKKTGNLSEFLFEPNNPLLVKHYQSNESIVQLLFSKLNVRDLVIEKLSGYPAEKIRDIIEDNIKKHLAWLEIFGVLLGCLFAFVYSLSGRLLWGAL